MIALTRRWFNSVMQQLAPLALVLIAAAPVQAQTETVEYYALDAIGSVRVVLDANGNIVGRMDYDPYGVPLSSAGGLPSRAYAGLFRDGEAGLDYAQARSYQARTGRFTTVDAVYAGVAEPQRWNRYAYALNGPLVYADAGGLIAESGLNSCSAEFSYRECGGDEMFWRNDFGRRGGISEFGGSYAVAQRNGYVPGMPAEMWGALEDFNQRVDDQIIASFLEGAETETIDAIVAQWPRILHVAGDAIRKLTPAAQRTLQGLFRLMGRSTDFDRARAALNNAQPVGKALQTDLFHQAAVSMQRTAAAHGTYFARVGNDGKPYTLIQYLGELPGKGMGRYEYIIDGAGQLTHQMFVRGGTITGVPIKP